MKETPLSFRFQSHPVAFASSLISVSFSILKCVRAVISRDDYLYREAGLTATSDIKFVVCRLAQMLGMLEYKPM